MNHSSELLVYKASAGSGKTFTLAVEYIKLLVLNPRAYRQILAVTFTNKATAEMKERILEQLYGIWKGDKDSKAYLENVCKGLELEEKEVSHAAGKALIYMIHDYSRFRVETIDSFFQSVMRNLARELELNANLNIELNNAEVLSDAVDSLFEKLDRHSPVLAWLLDYINERIASDKRWNVSSEIKSFGKNIFDEGYLEKGSGLRIKLKDPEYIKGYRNKLKAIQDEALEQMKSFADQFEGVIEEVGLSPLDLAYGHSGISGYFHKLSVGKLSDDIFGSRIQSCMESQEAWATKKSAHRDTILSLASSQLIELLGTAEEFRKKNNRLINSCELSLRHINKLRLLANIDEEVRDLNRKNNRFLLSDTNALLHKLVGEGDSSFVFEKIGANIRNVMIDEFQDTSRMQWDNFRLLLLEGLSQGSGSLIVGDVKQSIYRWRNGDWGILNSLKSKLGAFDIRVETLNINRRSETNVVRFNNVLFASACDYLCRLYESELGNECKELKEAYSDVYQEPAKTEVKGYVKIQPIEENAETDYPTLTLQQLGAEVEKLVGEGVKQTDITILVRKNKNIPLIADYFDKHLPYKIVSDEAFQLGSSLSVNLIMDALRYLSKPSDEISRAQLAIVYQNKVLHSNEEINTLLMSDIRTLLPEGFVTHTKTLRQMPLYELCEKIFSLFDLEQIRKQEAYLFAFFDALTEYLQNNSSEIDAFIAHWDEKLCRKNIPSGEVEGIRIYSIHKSKGLEFHTVLLPFCDWKLENETSSQLVWCIPEEAPFDELDIVPVNYSSAMAQSVYRKDYLNERLQLWVDNLNLLYVAFTRAKNNLIAYINPSQRNTVSELLAGILPQISEKLEMNPEEGAYEFGRRSLSEEKSKQHSDNRLAAIPTPVPARMSSMQHKAEFKQSNRSADFIRGKEETEKENRYIDKGQLLHALFSDIQNENDIESAASKLMFEGVIESEETQKEIIRIARRALANPQVADWYSGKWKLFNECAIIYKENGKLETRRPDRVMTKEGKTVVVDFKFGKQKPEYTLQVDSYMKLLIQMGYTNVEGYLWYVYENEIIRVNNLLNGKI